MMRKIRFKHIDKYKNRMLCYIVLLISFSIGFFSLRAETSKDDIATLENQSTVSSGRIKKQPPPTTASATGLNVTVDSFQVGSFSFPGGNLTVLANGTWFIGVDLFRNTLIALPRLGHRGWIPVARVVVGPSEVTTVEQITPVLPSCRIPRAMEKIRTGQPLKTIVMGSSLAEGDSTTYWSGMLFNSSSNPTAYKIPTNVLLRNIGLGASPNQYMLAQLGYALPSGRSPLFNNVDLVVLTCLANGGDYRLSIIEPLIRKLKTRGTEIILLTDNPQNPTSSYSTMLNTSLYSDGHEPLRIANLYGIELADTAAYVFEQQLRYGSGIYRDSIHMSAANPAGPNIAQPSCGYEVYARAVRSVMPIASQVVGTEFYNSTFTDTVQGFTPFASASVASTTGKLKIVKNTANTTQWGTWVDIPQVRAGDTLRIQGQWSFEDGHSGNLIQIGTQGGGSGWGSSVISPAPGVFDIVLKLNRDILSGGKLLFFANSDNAPINSAFSLDNLSITLNPTVSGIDLLPNRSEEVLPLPPLRTLTDTKTPSDAIVILPKDELHISSNHTSRGTLGAHPSGANSFARRFNASTSPTEDLLTVTNGQKATIHGHTAVGFSLIRHQLTTDASVTIEVRRNAILVKTLTLASTFNGEQYVPIFTPTEYGQLSQTSNDSVELTVTSGTLKICALVILTTDLSLLTPQILDFPTLADRMFGATPSSNTLTLNATSNAGITEINYTVTSGPATVSGSTLTITGPGIVNIQASQSGDATYAAATTNRSFAAIENVAPVIEPITTKTVKEGSSLSFSVTAYDTNSPIQQLSYALINPTVTANINPTTGLFSWLTKEEDGPETYDFTVRVSDGLLTTERVFTVNVTGVLGLPEDDTDNDGQKNFMEYLTGTNPLDSLDRFTTHLVKTQNGIKIEMQPCVPNVTYLIQTSKNMENPADWQNGPSLQSLSGENIIYEFSSNEPRLFLRVVISRISEL